MIIKNLIIFGIKNDLIKIDFRKIRIVKMLDYPQIYIVPHDKSQQNIKEMILGIFVKITICEISNLI